MLKNNLINFFIFSILSIPVLLITGPFLPDLIISINILIFLFLINHEKKFDIFKNNFSYLFLFFILISSLNSFYSENFKSIISSLGLIRFFLFILLTIYILNYLNIDLRLKLFKVLLICYCYLFFEFFSQVLLGHTLFGQIVTNSTRLVLSSLHHEEIISSYVVRFYPLFVGLYYLLKDKLSQLKILFYFLNIFIFSLVLFNGERTALGLFIILIIFMFIFLKINLKFKVSAVLISIISVGLIVLLLPSGNLERKTEGFKNLKNTYLNFNKKNKNSEIIFFSEKYNSLYRTSYNIFKQNKILGVGIKNFRIECSKEIYAHNERSCSTHPHNILLQIMAETGLIGIFYYLLILFSIVYFFTKNYVDNKISNNKKNYITCLFFSVILNVIPFFPSGNLFNNWISIIVFFPVGLLLSEFVKKSKN